LVAFATEFFIPQLFAMDSKCALYIKVSAFGFFTNQVPSAIWDGPTKKVKPKNKFGLF
jgi:hypothetical protein